MLQCYCSLTKSIDFNDLSPGGTITLPCQESVCNELTSTLESKCIWWCRMIESVITQWIAETIKTQGVTLAFVFVTSAWLMKRIDYLDKQLADYNKFMRDCLKDHIEPTEMDQFRGR